MRRSLWRMVARLCHLKYIRNDVRPRWIRFDTWSWLRSRYFEVCDPAWLSYIHAYGLDEEEGGNERYKRMKERECD